MLALVALHGQTAIVDTKDLILNDFNKSITLSTAAGVRNLQRYIVEESAQIALFPDTNAETKAFGEYLSTIFPPAAIRYFGSDAAFTTYCETEDYGNTLNPKIAFAVHCLDLTGPNFQYTVRLNSTGYFYPVTPRTNGPIDNPLLINASYSGGSNFGQYIVGGFTTIQQLTDGYILNKTTLGADLAAITLFPFPAPAHREDPFATYTSQFIGFLLTVAFVWPVTRLIKVFVEEKETRIREGMLMMGLQGSAHWISWFLTYALIFFVTATAIVIVTAGSVYLNSNKVLILLFYWLFGLAVTSFCFLISALFTSAKLASIMGALAFLGLYFPSLAFNEDTTASQKLLGCLSPMVCLGSAGSTMAKLESAQVGLQFDNINREFDHFAVGTAYVMFIVDIVLYLALALYLERVLPSTYGLRKPFYFPCLPSYWRTAKGTDDEGLVRTLIDRDPTPDQAKNVQVISGNKKATVQLRDLRKEWPSKSGVKNLVAVDNVYLNIYEGQILALLGHNGAGKSTTIGMLTGLYPPSGGDAVVDGLLLSREMDSIRKTLGVCPQDNRLFDSLTVAEHLRLYAGIKGVDPAEIEGEVEQMIQKVGLTEKVNVFSMALSGGMKRKLSLAIALIGGSKIVFLDEPTSGMDPYSRRSTWDLLKQMKQDRVIILTTHFMDEADYLGDRIAIMDSGNIQCCGSSLFLKSKYGVGYTMTITKAPEFQESAVVDLVNAAVETAGCRDIKGDLVTKAAILSNVAGELSFQLRFETSKQFPDLFGAFDEHQGALGIASYGISVTTLEEVFLRVGRGEDPSKTKSATAAPIPEDTNETGGQGFVASPKTGDSYLTIKDTGVNTPLLGGRDSMGDDGDTFDRPVGCRKFLLHSRALFAKRFHNARRNRKVWLWTVVYPVVLMLLGCGLNQLSAVSVQGPSLKMDLSVYASPNLLPYSSTPEAKAFLSTLRSRDGVVAQAVDPPPANELEFAKHLLATWRNQATPRYGAMFFDPLGVGEAVSVFVNATGNHVVPQYINLANNLHLRRVSGNASLSITVSSHPFPLSSEVQTYIQSSVALVLAIAFAFIPASYAAFIVLERETNVKHQQLISGVSVPAYWMSNLIWDLVNYSIPAALALVVCRIYSIDALIGPGLWPFVTTMLLFGLSVCAFTYMCSFAFDSHTTAQNVMLFAYIALGYILLIVSLILDIIPTTQATNKQLKFLYRIFPNYAFTEAISNIVLRGGNNQYGQKLDPWSLEVVGWPCIYLAATFVLYFLITLLIEQILASPNLLVRFQGSTDAPLRVDHEDDDVKEERRRVLSGEAAQDIIQLKGLRKVYPGGKGKPKVAVNDLSFGVHEGECFGFLGINGAGKSSALKMLTADTLPTAGTASLKGLDLMQEQEAVRVHLGYCPQFDALIDTLTARETLTLYARIKGAPERRVPGLVSRLVQQMGLSKYADVPCGGYSGGNKRKLSVAMALVGNPAIVFLDEPSTGMDPESRRFMWGVINRFMKSRSVILTTHSMEEAEALCGRIGIMVGGQLRCIGGAQHLKHRYGDGYQLDLHIGAQEGVASDPDADERRTRAAQDFVEATWGAALVEQQGNHVKYRLPKEGTSLGAIFSVIEQQRTTLHILEYSVSETSLEQIFLYFAAQQEEETGNSLRAVASTLALS